MIMRLMFDCLCVAMSLHNNHEGAIYYVFGYTLLLNSECILVRGRRITSAALEPHTC